MVYLLFYDLTPKYTTNENIKSKLNKITHTKIQYYNLRSYFFLYSDKFTIRGTKEAVERAKTMIMEKLGSAKDSAQPQQKLRQREEVQESDIGGMSE